MGAGGPFWHDAQILAKIEELLSDWVPMNGLEVFHILGTNMLQALYHIEKIFEVPVVFFHLKMLAIKALRGEALEMRVFIFLLFTHMVVTVLCKLNFSVLSCPLLSHQPTNSEV